MRQIAFAALFAGVLICSSRLAAQEVIAGPHGRSISTTGESVVYVTPDEVIVGLGVETYDSSLDKAKSTNDEASARLLRAVKELGVEDKHVQTDTLNIELRYRNRDNEVLTIIGYVARRQYSVTLKDTKLFEKLVDSAIKNGANRLMGFEFRSTELRKHRDQARAMAIKAAKEKAVALARELDMNVGKARTISEGYGGYFGNRGWYGWGGGNYMAQNSVQAMPAGEGGGGEGTMPLGQIGIRASVSVTFDLE